MEFLNWCLNHWGVTAFVLALFVQFTPIIKFNPFTALFSWIGKLITADLRGDIDKIKMTTERQEREMRQNEIDRIRYEVLNFASSCRNGVHHSLEEFRHIIALNTKYERLLNEAGVKNGVFENEYRYILDIYNKCRRDNDFI